VQITRGLLQKYGPERVKDTPITEVRNAAAMWLASGVKGECDMVDDVT
jgi:pyruvate/2-oxoglutarate/acetoin dehydrogenase E1 component